MKDLFYLSKRGITDCALGLLLLSVLRKSKALPE